MTSTQRQHEHPRNGTPPEPLDYYEVLGVPYSATTEDITRAYRRAMKRIHPDRQRSDKRAAAEEAAKLLNRAYMTLRRAESRREHDLTLRHKVVQHQIMNTYVRGFGGQDADIYGDRLRRRPTEAERRDQQRDDRNAMLSVIIVFGGVTLAVVMGLVIWAALNLLAEQIF